MSKEWQFRAGCQMCTCNDPVDRALTEATPDQLRVWSLEIGRRDQQFIRVVSSNLEEGQGEYEIRSSTNGRVLRRVFTFADDLHILTPRVPKPANAGGPKKDQPVTSAEAQREGDIMTDYTPPNPYEEGINALRAAEAPDSSFETSWKSQQRAAAAEMRAKLDAFHSTAEYRTA
jgi:hypothetical protein